MSDADLIEVCTEFRYGILSGRPSTDMCFAVCAPLQGYLSAMGLETVMMESDLGFVEHIWLKLPDGRCLDPTADQLNRKKRGKKFPPVYLGPVPRWYARSCWRFQHWQREAA